MGEPPVTGTQRGGERAVGTDDRPPSPRLSFDDALPWGHPTTQGSEDPLWLRRKRLEQAFFDTPEVGAR